MSLVAESRSKGRVWGKATEAGEGHPCPERRRLGPGLVHPRHEWLRGDPEGSASSQEEVPGAGAGCPGRAGAAGLRQAGRGLSLTAAARRRQRAARRRELGRCALARSTGPSIASPGPPEAAVPAPG